MTKDELTALEAKADELLRVAHEYWEMAQAAGVDGAVKWLEGTDGNLVLYTRGEYRQQLMNNIIQFGLPLVFKDQHETESN